MITFGNQDIILYLSLLTAVILALLVYYLFWRKKAVSLLIKNSGIRELLIKGSPLRSRIKAGLIIASLILFLLTVLRPQWGMNKREVNNEGSDVLIALDVSNSMMAQDIKPNRLERAKSAIRWLAESLKGDRIGLLLFAGDAFLQCPLTTDVGAFLMFLDSASPQSVKTQGTDIGRVLFKAQQVFKKKRLTSKLLVLVTDGEDHQGAALKAAVEFKKMGVAVYTVAIGKENGELIPMSKDDFTGDVYIKDKNDKFVRSSKNPKLLMHLAGFTGGAYLDISKSFSDLKFILQIIKDQQNNIYGTKTIKEKKERFQWLAVVLVILLSIELILPDRSLKGRNA